MAKRSLIENNNAKRRLVASKEKTRSALKAIIKNKDTNFEDRIAASHKLAQMPRNSSATRIRNRCEVSGRPRGFYRKFKISRIALRELSSNGLIPGVTKASW